MKRSRIFVVDDHAITRMGYLRLLEQEPDMEVCGEAANATEAMDRISLASPDLVIADISMEGTSGLELVRHLNIHYPHLPVLVASMYDEALYAERSLRAGARGYVMKSEVHTTILEASRKVLRGRIFLSERMQHVMLAQYSGGIPQKTGSPLERLTDRELEVFDLIGHGYATRHISAALHISPKTVSTYRSRIREKLILKDSTELLKRAVEWVQFESPRSWHSSGSSPDR